MLDGKRNRRADYLIYTLIKVAVPYYFSKHVRRQCGFEGNNLEGRKRAEVEILAQRISKESIAHLGSDKYSVQSQSSEGVSYEVDFGIYNCTCPDFSQISYCKHVCAVEQHFDTGSRDEEDRDSEPGDTADGDASESPCHAEFESSSLATTSTTPATSSLDRQLQTSILSQIIQDATSLLALSHSGSIFDDSQLTNICDMLSELSRDARGATILPPSQRLPPNKKTKTETREAYGKKMPAVKTGKKRLHEDPYSGGERSGKLAKLDARTRSDNQDSDFQDVEHPEGAKTSSSVSTEGLNVAESPETVLDAAAAEAVSSTGA